MNESVSHIKPHGALNNMACEDIELSHNSWQKLSNDISKDLIYLSSNWVKNGRLQQKN